MDIKPCGSVASLPGSPDYFTGRVRQEPIVDAAAPARIKATMVTFEPGARTAWHTHPLGQTLIVTSGSVWRRPRVDRSPRSVPATASGFHRAKNTGTAPARTPPSLILPSRKLWMARPSTGWNMSVMRTMPAANLFPAGRAASLKMVGGTQADCGDLGRARL